MNKNNNTIIIIIIIIILAVIAGISLKNRNPKVEEEPLSQSEIDLNQATNADSTIEISGGIDSIDLTDTSDEDLKGVDEELGNL